MSAQFHIKGNCSDFEKGKESSGLGAGGPARHVKTHFAAFSAIAQDVCSYINCVQQDLTFILCLLEKSVGRLVFFQSGTQTAGLSVHRLCLWMCGYSEPELNQTVQNLLPVQILM